MELATALVKKPPSPTPKNPFKQLRRVVIKGIIALAYFTSGLTYAVIFNFFDKIFPLSEYVLGKKGYEVLTDFALWGVRKGWATLEGVVRYLWGKGLFPVAKYVVDWNFRQLGWNTEAKGPLGMKVHNMEEFYIKLFLERNYGLFNCHLEQICTMNDVRAIAMSAMKTRKTRDLVHPLTEIFSCFNLQTAKRAKKDIADHYDIGNDLYELMLDRHMQYTCGYWRNAKDLDTAQVAKLDLIAKKLKLSPGMRVLDLGCGFGGLAYYLAKHYNVQVVACNISEEQMAFAANLNKGLPVDLKVCDYRAYLNSSTEKFDRMVCVGFVEHVGKHNYPEFFKCARDHLKDDGIFLVHTIGNNHPQVPSFDVWNHDYVFPSGYIAYYRQICDAIEGQFIIEDWQNFGTDYAKTLFAWEERFDKHWESKLRHKYGDRFHRLWKIYLHCAQAFFLSRSLQLWQIVLTKDGLEDGYLSIRE